MLVTTPLASSIVVTALGALILWSNPSRPVSRAVALCSLHIAAWLTCLHFATVASAGAGLYWVRWACAVGAGIPLSFWIVKESILGDLPSDRGRWLVLGTGWLGVSTILVGLPFTDVFVPAHSTASNRIFGWGYYAYMWSLLALYVFMFTEAFRGSRKLVGVHRLELQIWIGGGCAMVSSVIVTMALNAITHERIFIQIQPVLVLLFFGVIAVAITARRIFDARQIFIVATEKSLLVLVVSGLAYAVEKAFAAVLPVPLDFLATTAVMLWFIVVFNHWLDRVFRFYPQATDARQAAFAAAKGEKSVAGLANAFRVVLQGWGQTDHVLLIHGTRNGPIGEGIEQFAGSDVVDALHALRWATPERLSRERSSAGKDALAKFLNERGLGLLVVGEGPSLTIWVGIGVPASRRPFTYPQVSQLIELVSIIGGGLERAVFAAKAQHAEQLATVGLLGASLAHEIRNPLVSIKTFVQLLPTHHQDPAFRQKFFRLIGHEVDRIDRLTVQLLELASPRSYQAETIELHPVLRNSLELVATKAEERRVDFVTDFAASPDLVFADASAAKQVMLNLCFNAIQAAETREGVRWVRVSTRNTAEGVEMSVADSGPGISAEIRARLFQPFQTTKSTGFGLGLAICRDILANLNATITVDAHVPGQGATFRVIFPCQPLSS